VRNREKLHRLFWEKKVKNKEKYYSCSKPQIYNVRNKISPSKLQRSIILVQNRRDIISKPQRSIIPVQNLHFLNLRDDVSQSTQEVINKYFPWNLFDGASQGTPMHIFLRLDWVATQITFVNLRL
jgi:hypothetical protein